MPRVSLARSAIVTVGFVAVLVALPWIVEAFATKPPDEVARDPERLALWTTQQRERQDRENEDTEVYELRGCDRQVLWACDHPTVANGEVYLGMVSCEEGPYPAGSRKPW